VSKLSFVVDGEDAGHGDAHCRVRDHILGPMFLFLKYFVEKIDQNIVFQMLFYFQIPKK
jgi:hypothetical protein